MNLVSPYNYTNNVVHLNKNDILDQPAFDNLELSAKYWLNVRHCYRYGKKNPQQLFEIFGYFNSEEPEDVRSDICTHINMELELYAKVGTVHLLFIGSGIEKWLKAMKNNRNYGDPLMLYALSRTFQRHSVVLCANRAWSTVGTDDPIDSDRLLEICHVKLVYIGHNMFGELREKSVLSISSSLAITDATSATVSGTNKPVDDIKVCFEPSTADKDVPALDTLDYVDLSVLSDFDDYSDDTIVYSLPGNSTNIPESPLLNINNTTGRPIGTGYYTKLDDKDDENTGDIPRKDIVSSVATGAINTSETTVTVLSLNGETLANYDVQDTNSQIVSGINIEHDYNVQGTNDSPDNVVSGMNTESCQNVQGTNRLLDSSVSGLNKTQENIVSGMNVADDHNYAMKGINSADGSGKNNACDPEITDVNGINSVHIMDNAEPETSIKTINVDIEPRDSDPPKDAEERDSIMDGNSSTDTISKLCNLFLVKNPEASLYQMWKKDATKNRLIIKVKKMNKEEIYRMSHPTPNWSALDPYSSLEEILSESENEKETDNVPTQNNKCVESTSVTQSYFMRERTVNQPSRSLHSVALHNYKEDSDDSDDNDSDYTPVPETVKNVNPRLRRPSKERMNAQCQITVNRECLGLPVSKLKNIDQSSSELTDPPLDHINSSTGNSGKMTTSNPVLSTKSTLPTPPTPSPSSSAGNNPESSVQAFAGVTNSSLHKRKPKPHSKHHRPASQLTSDSPATSDISNTQSLQPNLKVNL